MNTDIQCRFTHINSDYFWKFHNFTFKFTNVVLN